MIIVFLRQANPGIICQSGRTSGDVGQRRDDVADFPGFFRVPHLFGIPWTPLHRLVDELKTDAPPAIAPFHQVNPPRLVAGVRVIVAGKQVAEFVESEFLRISMSVGEDLQVGPVQIAASPCLT
jgi:hypothetical protein